jgi:hypothetical protein
MLKATFVQLTSQRSWYRGRSTSVSGASVIVRVHWPLSSGERQEWHGFGRKTRHSCKLTRLRSRFSWISRKRAEREQSGASSDDGVADGYLKGQTSCPTKWRAFLSGGRPMVQCE